MHELSICQALVARVADLAGARHSAVRCVHVGVGPLAGVEAELLARAYPLAAAGTSAQGSELSIQPMPLTVECRDCGVETQAMPDRLLCAECGSPNTRLASGDELLLLRVEMQEPEPCDA